MQSNAGICSFTINDPFESVIIPERNYVVRNESVEMTLTWMSAGNIEVNTGNEQAVLKLVNPVAGEGCLIKAIRLSLQRQLRQET